MLGVEALGVFALGQEEPWELKGQQVKRPAPRASRRGKQAVWEELPPIKPEIPAVKIPWVDPRIDALLLARQQSIEAQKRDDDEAITVLLMAA